MAMTGTFEGTCGRRSQTRDKLVGSPAEMQSSHYPDNKPTQEAGGQEGLQGSWAKGSFRSDHKDFFEQAVHSQMIKGLKITKALGANILNKEAFHGDQNALLKTRLFTDIDDLQEIQQRIGRFTADNIVSAANASCVLAQNNKPVKTNR